jgi:hypothetical protein
MQEETAPETLDSSVQIVEEEDISTQKGVWKTHKKLYSEVNGKDPKLNPLAPYKLYIAERKQKDLVNVSYTPLAQVSPIYDWKSDEIPVENDAFLQHVKAFMVASDALMC